MKDTLYRVYYTWACSVVGKLSNICGCYDLTGSPHNMTNALLADWYPGIPISRGIHWLYMVQMGFYIHCAYASIYLETIRRDFVVLMLHHILTLGLLMFSYIVRYVHSFIWGENLCVYVLWGGGEGEGHAGMDELARHGDDIYVFYKPHKWNPEVWGGGRVATMGGVQWRA